MAEEQIPGEVQAAWAVDVLTGPVPETGQLEAWEQRLMVCEHLTRWTAAMAAEARTGILEALRERGTQEFVAETVAMVEECSPRGAEARLSWSVTLADDLPVTLHLLRECRIPLASARAVAEAAAPLTREECTALEQKLWPLGLATVPSHTGRRVKAVRAQLRRHLPAIRPVDVVEAMVTAARGERRVECWPGEPGTDTASVHAELTAPDAAAVMASLDARAQEARSGGDTRSIDTLRADALVELVTGQTSFALWADSGHDGPAPELARHWSVQVTVGLDVLLAAEAQTSGTVTRTGAVTGITAHHLARAAMESGGRVTRLVTDPLSGTLVDTVLLGPSIPTAPPPVPPIATIVEGRYEPSAALARFVRARDRHCQFPGCGIPATRCELDHIDRYNHDDPAAGGQTTAVNLTCLCKHHHRMKHSHGWELLREDDGRLTWFTPSGDQLTHDPPDARAG